MNRRLIAFREMDKERRYKTADTRISASRKLPKDFFPSRKSITTPPEKLRKMEKSSLPSLKQSFDRNNS